MFARTERLFLRPMWPEDAEAVAACIGHWQVVSMLGAVPWPYRREDAAEKIARDMAGAPHAASLLIFLRGAAGAELAGGVGVRIRPDGLYERGAELGYWIAERFWGRGIAVEAARAMIEIAFLGLGHELLNAAHFVDNPRSGRVLEKLGFRATGVVRPHPCLARGAAADCAEYALSRAEWCGGRLRAAA